MTRRIGDIKKVEKSEKIARDKTAQMRSDVSDVSNKRPKHEEHDFAELLEDYEDLKRQKENNDDNSERLKEESLEEFKESKIGKNISSFGTLLIVSGIFGLLSCLYTLTLGAWMVLLTLVISLPINCYFISVGSKVQKFQFTSDELDDKTKTIIILSILNIFFGISAFFSLFIWIDTYRYYKTWRHTYKFATAGCSANERVEKDDGDMTPLEYVSEVKKATSCENEVRRQLRKMSAKERTSISTKNLKLNIFVLGYDSDRYLHDHLYSNNPDLKNAGYAFQGMIDIYKLVLKDRVWRDSSFLKKQYRETAKTCEEHPYDIYSYGKLKAIAGIMDQQLYYTWSDGDMPIQINPGFVQSLEKRHLL